MKWNNFSYCLISFALYFLPNHIRQFQILVMNDVMIDALSHPSFVFMWTTGFPHPSLPINVQWIQ